MVEVEAVRKARGGADMSWEGSRWYVTWDGVTVVRARGRLVRPDRVILANVVYPLLVPERGALWHEYLDLPALLDNEKVKRAALRLFGLSPHAKDFQRKLHHQQGLLQLYEDFCLEDDSGCEDCPFPERLAQWRA